MLLGHPEHLLFAGSGVATGRTTVALVDGHLVGFASIADGGPMQLELEDLFVDPVWQRRGIARLLIADIARPRAATRRVRSWSQVTRMPACSI